MLRPNPHKLLASARALSIPAGWSGPWLIQKLHFTRPFEGIREGKPVFMPAGTYTQLKHSADLESPVMEDSPYELRTHLDFMMRAHGSVLITGLGLGCVVRGCLANPNVRHIVCVEKSADVLALVAPHMPQEKLSIIHADALEWVKKADLSYFDVAWHDLWSNEDAAEPHLQVLHSALISECCEHVEFQGAWEFPRYMRRAWNDGGGGLIKII